MKFYHRTTADVASRILREGFKGAVGTYLTDREHRGVWVSDAPLDESGAGEGVLLLVTLEIAKAEQDFYEWVEDGKVYREWLIPAPALCEARIALGRPLKPLLPFISFRQFWSARTYGEVRYGSL